LRRRKFFREKFGSTGQTHGRIGLYKIDCTRRLIVSSTLLQQNSTYEITKAESIIRIYTAAIKRVMSRLTLTMNNWNEVSVFFMQKSWIKGETSAGSLKFFSFKS
jgi:hypothetical protein